MTGRPNAMRISIPVEMNIWCEKSILDLKSHHRYKIRREKVVEKLRLDRIKSALGRH